MFGIKKKEATPKKETDQFKAARERALIAMVEEEVGFHNGHAICLRHLLHKFGIDKKNAENIAASVALLYDREMHAEWKRLFDIGEDLSPGHLSRKKRLKFMNKAITIFCFIWLPLWIIYLVVMLVQAFMN